MTQDALAKALGIQKSAVGLWEIGRSQPAAKNLPALTRVLQMSIDNLLSESLPPLPNETTPASVSVNIQSLPNDVPVLGTVQGGAGDGDFSMNGEVVDHVRRPAGIAQNKQAFALYVHGDSMAPWRQPGGLVYINPQRPPASGDHVVVELLPAHPGDPAPCQLKKLVRHTGTHLVLAQYNPPREFKVQIARIARFYRVMEWEELLQV